MLNVGMKHLRTFKSIVDGTCVVDNIGGKVNNYLSNLLNTINVSQVGFTNKWEIVNKDCLSTQSTHFSLVTVHYIHTRQIDSKKKLSNRHIRLYIWFIRHYRNPFPLKVYNQDACVNGFSSNHVAQRPKNKSEIQCSNLTKFSFAQNYTKWKNWFYLATVRLQSGMHKQMLL